jgi:hypothetical protein
VLAAELAIVAIAGAVAFVVLRDEGPEFAQPGPASSASLLRVDRSVVSVTATAADPDAPNYGVQLATDGDLSTAWHSGGHLIATNVGVEVRFTFTRPVKLARITIVNGFARSPADFTNNQRITKMRVQTEAAQREWTVKDSADPQSLDLDGAPTKTVTFVVEATVAGTKFKDVCITEVTFDELA